MPRDLVQLVAERRRRTPGVSLERRGGHWSVRLEGSAGCHVRHSRGMAYLSVLVANPGREISAADLVIGPEPDAPVPAWRSGNEYGQTLLDERAVGEYRHRLHVLNEEIERLDKLGDQTRSIKVHAELAWLHAQLKSAAGPSSRRRTFATTDERARIAVGKAIRRALGYIRAADPVLGDVLAQSVKTGRHCVFFAGWDGVRV
jgi:uncharacterized small protein (DUF1192 family)